MNENEALFHPAAGVPDQELRTGRYSLKGCVFPGISGQDDALAPRTKFTYSERMSETTKEKWTTALITQVCSTTMRAGIFLT